MPPAKPKPKSNKAKKPPKKEGAGYVSKEAEVSTAESHKEKLRKKLTRQRKSKEWEDATSAPVNKQDPVVDEESLNILAPKPLPSRLRLQQRLNGHNQKRG
eukprot:Protomagalhaensia_wolfi_Nauph_80__6157@NODE_900_length_1899_cov_26_543011_g678_i0_p2_GENE_NODE_900_length_1899_cov_26_543011_g678_i0NODE_900_length_1899_cov_26_543011_g678_i0_p2_ORF_typecomplete_len101_score19_14_NODE_900_length_1899_cov_26_543011_g678_i015601862